ncbi:uncharacterized mitochondrial protein-like protein [Tanacetum coccineum]
MFIMGASHTLEATHIEFFSNEDEPEVDLGNITNSYTVPTTSNTRIHKDHPIKNVIGDVKLTVQTRRMTKPTSEQGFLRAVYEQKTHDTLNTYLPIGKRAIGTKWVFKNKKVERGIVIRNKARGKIDQTLFIKKQKRDILLVQVYVDDITFGSTNKDLCTGFKKLMKDKFQMSSMGELTFFLGLQVQQKEDGIFINQDKYVAEILKKFNYIDVKSASTPVDLEKPLVKDRDANDVDVHLYRSMIGSLMYLTTSRPDIMFVVCACARFQVTPKTLHILAVKRIFRYLKGKSTLGLWYSRDSPFEIVAYTDSDYDGVTQDRKSTTEDLLTKGLDAGRHVKRGRDTKIPQSSGPPVKVGDEAIHKELGDRMERAATTASSLEAEQDSGGTDCLPTATIFEELARMSAKSTAWNEFSSTMASLIICLATNQNLICLIFINQQLGDMSHHKKIYVNPSHTKKIFANMRREGKDFSGRVTPLFETMMVQANQEEGVDSGIPTDSQQTPITTQPSSSRSQKKQSRRKQRKDTTVTQEETQHDDSVPTPSNDPPLSGEDSMQLSELIILCTNLQKQVLDLEKAKDAQAKEIADLKNWVQTRVESFEDKDNLGDHEDASKQGRSIEDIDKDADVSLVDDTQGRSDDAEMFDTNELHGDEVVVDMPVGEKQEQSTKEREVNTSVEDSVAPTTIEEITLAQTLIQIKAAKPKVVTTAATTTTTRPKARGVVVQEPKKNQVSLDEDLERNLQAQLEAELIEEESLARKKEEEANIALIESWDNTQAMMEADFELAQRLQTEEQLEITIKERSRLFVVKSKNETEESSKGTEDELKSDKSKKSESSEEKAKGRRKKMLAKKRAGKEKQQESSKRQRIEDVIETDEHEEVEEVDEAELKKHLVIVKDDDIAIDAIPLATKPPVIVEYKLFKEGIMAHYQLIRAYGSSKIYFSMIRMLQGIDKEDLQTLWKLVKTKHGDTRPEDEHERVLWGDLKVMFEPDIKSDVWRNLQGYKVTIWKLYDSCGVHFVRFENVHIFMLVEKRYPLTPITITNMLNKKLQTDYWNEMCYQLLKLMKMNIKFRGGLLRLKRLQGFLELLLLSTAGTKSLCCWITTARRLTTVKRLKTV